mgnify:CR=1 FL=1
MFQDLIDRKLVKGSTVGDLTIFKYTKRVFFDNLWNEDPRLLDARGIVLDSDGNKVIWPFTKVFNYGENGTTVPRDQKVKWVRKVNGFMAAARWHNDSLLVSSTGSLTSDYVQLAHQVITKYAGSRCALWASLHEYTMMFEICDPSDPHIVAEEAGAYLIGMREMKTGRMMSEQFCDWVAVKIGCKRPEHGEALFSEVVKWSKLCEHEGFMIRSLETGELLLKLKSVYYLTKKFLMRMGGSKVDFIYDQTEKLKETIDEEYYCVLDFITQNINREYWKELTDQERRETLEGFFNEQNALLDQGLSG